MAAAVCAAVAETLHIDQRHALAERGSRLAAPDSRRRAYSRLAMSQRETKVEARVARAAAAALERQQYVTALDVLVDIGWLAPAHLDDWRHRRIPFLEAAVQAGLPKISAAMRAFRAWAATAGLRPSETAYVARSVGREPLQFSRSGDAALERAYRTHWISPALGERRRARLEAKASAPPPLVAVEPHGAWTCHRCAGTGAWLVMEAGGPACLGCLGFGDLVWLPASDATATRRARQSSPRHLVVVRWSRAHKRYHRIGLLVEPAALSFTLAATPAAAEPPSDDD